ncbi:hypothetical protein PVAND_015487 [Polypedilum vanderplanki]|uniref:Peptidase S1 domain-containing protein n=1 Tax=Polypedilum vanderplanki TaxID=319348 RepID=A0A9J6BCD5_POLVA|nr:hypothetical protein PVAND_015487 [Polypedilum vanderplanki]
MSRKFFFIILVTFFKICFCYVEIPSQFRDAKSPMASEFNLDIIQMNFPGLYDDVFAGIEGRIAGGVAADARQFPYQGLMYMVDNKNATFICGGSLITHSFLLTAAHCLYQFEEISVFLGVTNRVSGPAAFSQDITDKSHIIMHNLYNPTGHVNDIGLIYLSTLTAEHFDNKRISLITLPTRNDIDVNLVGMEATVAGFGSTSDTNKASEILRYVTMPIIKNSMCKMTFGTFIKATNLCMSGQGGRSVCSGDSGSPLTVELLPGKIVQVGIVSFGHKHGCTLGHPGVFTRVTSYLDWIEGHVGKMTIEGAINNSPNTTDSNKNSAKCVHSLNIFSILLLIIFKFF